MKFFRTFVLLLSVSLLFSCKKNEIDPIEPKADYTVLFYATTGGDLDDSLAYNIGEIENAPYSPKVNFVGRIKFSSSYQDDEDTAGTIKIVKNENELQCTKVADEKWEFGNPDNIASFINESIQEFPAEKYILIVWNHGSSFGPVDVPLSRSIMIDDNFEQATAVSIFNLEAGIKKSDLEKFDLIYGDLCHMNNIETICQLNDCADYFMGSAAPAPGMGGDYVTLFNALVQHSDIESFAKEYISKCVANWAEDTCKDLFDLSLVDLSKMEVLCKDLADVMAWYKDYYASLEDKSVINKAQHNLDYNNEQTDRLWDGKEGRWGGEGYLWYYDNANILGCSDEMANTHFTLVDILQAFYQLNDKVIKDSAFKAKIDALESTISSTVLVKECINVPENYMDHLAGISAIWVTNKRYEGFLPYKEPQYGTHMYSFTYPYSRFESLTNWSSYFKVYDAVFPIFEEAE